MLKKLMKYDFYWINKIMPIYFAIAIFFAICFRVISTFESTLIVTILKNTFLSLLISSLFSTLITYLMRIWGRYKSNIYKDESYLTHTLPVSKSAIFNSKIITSLISILIGSIVILICLAIAFLNNDTINLLKTLFESFEPIYEKGTLIGLIIAVIGIVILEIMYMMQAGIFGLTIGHRANNHKMLKAIVIGIASYFILSALTLAIIYVISLFNPTLTEVFNTQTPSKEAVVAVIYISLAVYMIYNLAFYFTSKKILNKGVNVE